MRFTTEGKARYSAGWKSIISSMVIMICLSISLSGLSAEQSRNVGARDIAALAAKFDQSLAAIPIKQWSEVTREIELPKGTALNCEMLDNKSHLIMTIAQDKRTNRLCFLDCATMKTSEISILSDPEDHEFTIEAMESSPDNRSLWLAIGIMGFPGTTTWCRFDIETMKLDADKQYRETLKLNMEQREMAGERLAPGPVWSAIGHRFFATESDANANGVYTFWRGTSAEYPPVQLSSIQMAGINWEFVLTHYNRGHVFVEGDYVTSVTTAYPANPQLCWFLVENGITTIYNFENPTISWKARLGQRSISNVWDVPGKGVLVLNVETAKEKIIHQYLDLIPEIATKDK